MLKNIIYKHIYQKTIPLEQFAYAGTDRTPTPRQKFEAIRGKR